MAIYLEFIDFVVPITTIEAKYPGGWVKCRQDYANALGRSAWHDDHLFRDGAMSSSDIGSMVEEWTKLGFDPFEMSDSQKHWKDFCVIESVFGGPTLPCGWLVYAERTRSAYLQGTEPGTVSGPYLRDA